MLAEDRKWRFGVLSSTGAGHLNPLIALSQELTRRGHTVAFFGQPKIEARVRDAGLGFFSIGAPNFTDSELPRRHSSGIRLDIETLRGNLARLTREMDYYLRKTPPVLAAAGIDALLIDEIALTGPTVAEMLGVPYFLLSTSVPHRFGWRSGWMSAWNGASWLGRSAKSPILSLQSALLDASALSLRGTLRKTLNRLRRDVGLGPLRRLSSQYPCLAHITQLPRCLDSRRNVVPANFFYSGLWLNGRARKSVLFPWGRLDGRPVVYVTLGTTRHATPDMYSAIAEACSGFGVQLVVALGDRFDAAIFRDLPGRPIVVRFAPQLELLKVATLVIAHGGCNTSLETLIEGKPLVVVPLAWDQPAIAARLQRVGVAEVVPGTRLSAGLLRKAIAKVLTQPRYRMAAERIQSELLSLDGAQRAAAIIEVELAGRAARRRLAPEAQLTPKIALSAEHIPPRATASYRLD